MGRVRADDSIGLASYTMDSHNCERIVIDGHPRTEGNVEVHIPGPYPLSYRAIIPSRTQCANLVVPAALSASHIAYGSIRMEPVFMILGQAAGAAAAQAVVAGTAVQDVDYTTLRGRLLGEGAILQWPPPPPPFRLDAPHAVAAAEPATVTATLRNDSSDPITGVRLEIAAPAGWSVQASSPTTFDEVHAGESVAASWKATPPAPSEPMTHALLAGTARYTATFGAVSREASASLYVAAPVADPYRTFAAAEAYFGQLGDRLAILASGADLWTGTDEYGAIYLPGAAGERAVVTARIRHQDPTDPDARAGLMLRDDVTGPGRSRGYVVVAAKPQHGFLLLWDADGNGYVESVARADTGATPYPAWLRLERDGATATGSYSTDGSTWHVIGQAHLPSASASQDAALFATSHAPSLGVVDYDAFTVTNAG
jgi:hypothetical protein